MARLKSSVTFVSGRKRRTPRNIVRMMAAKTKRVPEILSCELTRTGATWLSMITPIQNPTFVMETVTPGLMGRGEEKGGSMYDSLLTDS